MRRRPTRIFYCRSISCHPVVATPAGCAGLRAYLGQVLVEANDAESFAAAIIDWLRDPDEARRQGKLACEAVVEFDGRSRKELREVTSGV